MRVLESSQLSGYCDLHPAQRRATGSDCRVARRAFTSGRSQNTDGSRGTRHYLMPMRQIGASARTMLEATAAKRWAAGPEVKAVDREVVHDATGRRIGFGDLAADAAKR